MIQTIACVLVAMYGADANRLLLQAVPPGPPGIYQYTLLDGFQANLHDF